MPNNTQHIEESNNPFEWPYHGVDPRCSEFESLFGKKDPYARKHKEPYMDEHTRVLRDALDSIVVDCRKAGKPVVDYDYEEVHLSSGSFVRRFTFVSKHTMPHRLVFATEFENNTYKGTFAHTSLHSKKSKDTLSSDLYGMFIEDVDFTKLPEDVAVALSNLKYMYSVDTVEVKKDTESVSIEGVMLTLVAVVTFLLIF